jgi:hypothetical protein
MEDRRLHAHRWLRLPGLLQGEAPPCMSADTGSEHSLRGRPDEEHRQDRPSTAPLYLRQIRAMPASSDTDARSSAPPSRGSGCRAETIGVRGDAQLCGDAAQASFQDEIEFPLAVTRGALPAHRETSAEAGEMPAAAAKEVPRRLAL